LANEGLTTQGSSDTDALISAGESESEDCAAASSLGNTALPRDYAAIKDIDALFAQRSFCHVPSPAI
jgi:hypothetical protein